jgi:hypothetical protein
MPISLAGFLSVILFLFLKVKPIALYKKVKCDLLLDEIEKKSNI